MKKMRGGDYMEPNKELKFGGSRDRSEKITERGEERMQNKLKRQSNRTDRQLNRSKAKTAGLQAKQASQAQSDSAKETRVKTRTARKATKAMGNVDYSVKGSNVRNMSANKAKASKIIDRGEKRLSNIENREANKNARRSNRRMLKGGEKPVRKKAVAGAVVAPMVAGLAGSAMQNSKNENVQKAGQVLSTGSQMAGPMMGKGDTTTAKKGKMKKYKVGGAKPDFLDLDKDGNTTEPMKNATAKNGKMKDRRAKSGKMKGEKKKPVRSAE
jgi:hypothetical protein